jgi:peptide/nickel transport system substrate-binding protein
MTSRSRLFLLGAALASASACAKPSGCPSGWCGTLVVAAGPLDVLLPPVSQSDVGAEINDLVFNKLADVGPGLNTIGDSGFVPQLAERWSFENPTTIRFTLNPRARWQDGVPVTANDVAFTFSVYRDTLVNAPARPLLDGIRSVAALDAQTVVFRFTHAYPEEFYDAVYQMRILPAHILDTVPRARLASHPFGRHPIGSGPYRFVRWEAGQYVELAADSSYFLGRPGIPRVIFRVASDMGAALNQVLGGEADVINFYGTPEMVQRFRQTPGLRIIPYTPNAYSYIGFNFRDPAHRDRPNALFADRALRRAISMAVNVPGVVDAVLGNLGEVAPGPLTSSQWIWSDSLKALPFDSAAARRALDQLGWRMGQDGVRVKNGRRLEFDLLVPATSTVRKRTAVVVQDQLKRAGIDMHITELDLNTFLDRAAAGRFDAAFLSWTQDPTPSTLRQDWTGSGVSNYQHYEDPAFDRLVAKAIDEPIRARAIAVWRQAIRVIDDDAPAIWLFGARPFLIAQDRLEHITLRPDQWAALLWTWRINPDSLLPRDRTIAQ